MDFFRKFTRESCRNPIREFFGKSTTIHLRISSEFFRVSCVKFSMECLKNFSINLFLKKISKYSSRVSEIPQENLPWVFSKVHPWILWKLSLGILEWFFSGSSSHDYSRTFLKLKFKIQILIQNSFRKCFKHPSIPKLPYEFPEKFLWKILPEKT